MSQPSDQNSTKESFSTPTPWLKPSQPSIDYSERQRIATNAKVVALAELFARVSEKEPKAAAPTSTPSPSASPVTNNSNKESVGQNQNINTPTSLESMNVLAKRPANPDQAYSALQQNYLVAQNASSAIKNGSLNASQLQIVLKSFRDANLPDHAKALEKQSKTGNVSAAIKEINAAQTSARDKLENSIDEERTITYDQAKAEVIARMNDPKNLRKAKEQANRALIEAMKQAGVKPDYATNAPIVEKFLKDPKTIEAYAGFAAKIGKEKHGVDFYKLPKDTQEFILSSAGQSIKPAQISEIAKIKNEKGDDAARSRLLEISEPGLSKGFEEIKSGTTVKKEATPTNRATEEQQKLQQEVLRGLEGMRKSGLLPSTVKP